MICRMETLHSSMEYPNRVSYWTIKAGHLRVAPLFFASNNHCKKVAV